MNKLVFGFLLLLISACQNEMQEEEVLSESISSETSDGIPVLNFGTVHLSGSSDAFSSVSDINDPETKANIKKIVAELVRFKPTIICVEIPPESTDFMNEVFEKYKSDQSQRINYSEEVNVIGLEVARLSGAKKIFGIDNPLGFDYPSLIEMANKQEKDSLYVQRVLSSYERQNQKPLLAQYVEINSEPSKRETFDFYNFLGTMHSPNQFEGADIIAEFYKRNLRMYSNFRAIPMSKDDRVLILMGATHTAYFDVFIGNSPEYQLVHASDYTNF